MNGATTRLSGPRIYNLFPLLAGPLPRWQAHLERIRSLGFDWVFINPIHLAGYSGSLYAIKDHTAIDPRFIDPTAGDPQMQLREMLAIAKTLGLRVLSDFVINHTAFDCVLVTQHPDWYKRGANGKPVHPGAKEGNHWVTWGDLFEIDNASSPDRGALWHYWLRLAQSYLDSGFSGFRCDAAYKVPAALWQFLFHHVKQTHPEAVFFAESLGCPAAETVQLAQLGFDFIFNSSKWWDFTEPWCLEQYRQTAPIVPSISFPESHDTERLATELGGNQAAVKQRYAFAALFSTGVMMPMGFEYGFRRRLDVVKTTPNDWETPLWDLCDYITRVNGLKAARRVFNEEGTIASLAVGNPHIMALVKSTGDKAESAILILNKDLRNTQFCDLGRWPSG